MAKPVKLTTEIASITPEIAASYLAANTRNRKLNKGKVKRYATAMVQKRWFLHHQGIAFDTQGRLADGQHRLQAVVDTGLTVDFMVTHGVPSASLLVIDVDGHRTAADNFGIEGYDKPNMLSSRCFGLLAMEVPGTYRNVPYPELKSVASYYRAGLDWSMTAVPHGKVIGTGTVASALAYCWMRNGTRIDAFAATLRTQEGMIKNTPEHTLFRYLMNRGPNQGGSFDQEVRGAVLQAAYCACVGKELLRLNTGFYTHPTFRHTRDTMLAYFAEAYPKPRKRLMLAPVEATVVP